MRWYKHNVEFRNSDCYKIIKKELGYKGLDVFRNLIEIIHQRGTRSESKRVSMPWSMWLIDLKLGTNQRGYLEGCLDVFHCANRCVTFKRTELSLVALYHNIEIIKESDSLDYRLYNIEYRATDAAEKESKLSEIEVGDGEKEKITKKVKLITNRINFSK